MMAESAPACNNGHELSGKAVTVAWRNAKRMVAQGYLWKPDGLFYKEAGCVITPLGKCYHVWLPGEFPNHPEGSCSCPFFSHNKICKHVYFGVEQVKWLKAFAPALVEQAAKEYRAKCMATAYKLPAPGF